MLTPPTRRRQSLLSIPESAFQSGQPVSRPRPPLQHRSSPLELTSTACPLFESTVAVTTAVASLSMLPAPDRRHSMTYLRLLPLKPNIGSGLSDGNVMPPCVTTTTRAGRIGIARSRALVTDILRLHQRNPTFAHDRVMPLLELAEARDRAAVRISWSALFIKAWSEVCSRHPSLRQTWRTFPWPHIFQHQTSVANLAVSRVHDGVDWLCWGLIRSPEQRSLAEIQAAIDAFSNEPVNRKFARQLKLSGLPTIVRRAIWWWNLNIAGEKRATRLGTFSLTTVSGRGVAIQHPPTVMTTGLTFGPLDHNGRMKVTLVYDHRLMDGSYVADRLIDLELQLNEVVLTELRELCRSAQSSTSAEEGLSSVPEPVHRQDAA
jgi:pyruvate/2-oxoglutarate dehydrogenase complex dihydrolipoamide acyltransferase (E2) component